MKLFGRMMVFVSILALVVSAVAFAGDHELPGDCGDDCTCDAADCCGDCHSDGCTCDCDCDGDCDHDEDCDCDEDCGCGSHGGGVTTGHCGGCH